MLAMFSRVADVFAEVASSGRRKGLSGNAQDLEARVGIERGTFTVPNLTHSVSRVSIAYFTGVQALFATARPTLRIAPSPPPHCTSGEESGVDFGAALSA
jgi:hypothetical protein